MVACTTPKVCGVRCVSRAVGPRALGAEQFLNHPQRHPPFQQMGRIGVPQRMDGGIFGETTLAHHRVERILEGGGGQGYWLAPGGEQPGPGVLELPGRSPQLQGPFGQGHITVLAPVASSDPDPHALGVDVRDLQRRPFRQAQSTGLDHPQPHPGLRVVDQGQQGADLLRTQHERQFLALAGANARQDWPRSLERNLVEEFDPVEMDAERALGDLLLIEQEEEVRAELLFAELVGSAPVVLSQLVNGLDITLLGPGGEPPQLQVFAHTVSEGSHRDPPVRVGHDLSHKASGEQDDTGSLRRATEGEKDGTSTGYTRTLPRSGFVQLVLGCWHVFLLLATCG